MKIVVYICLIGRKMKSHKTWQQSNTLSKNGHSISLYSNATRKCWIRIIFTIGVDWVKHESHQNTRFIGYWHRSAVHKLSLSLKNLTKKDLNTFSQLLRSQSMHLWWNGKYRGDTVLTATLNQSTVGHQGIHENAVHKSRTITAFCENSDNWNDRLNL